MSKGKVPFGYIAVERVSSNGKTYTTTCTPDALPIFEKRGYRKATIAPPPVEAKAPEEAKKRPKIQIEGSGTQTAKMPIVLAPKKRHDADETLTENDGDQ